MEVHVISLKRTPDRLAGFIAANPTLRARTFDAVDGLKLTAQDQRVMRFGLDRLQWTAGSIGSCLSHMALWELALSTGSPATICEDDAVFQAEFTSVADRLVAQLDSWDFILWGWNFDSILWLDLIPGVSPVAMTFDQNALRDRIGSFNSKDLGPYALRRLLGGYGIPAYSISPRGAEKFLRATTPVRPTSPWSPILNRHVAVAGLDIVLNTIYASTESWVCFPPLVVTPNCHETSTIQGSAAMGVMR